MNASHPADPEPSINGHSIGRWEGDTLVIDTVGLKDFTFLTRAGAPRSLELKSTERWRQTDADTLSLELTVTDSDALTAPWVVKRVFKRDEALIRGDFECNENPRHVTTADGQVRNPADPAAVVGP
jgi:hypothetical protein